MNDAAISRWTLHLTWGSLVLATLVGVGTAEFLGHRSLAAAAIMMVAGIKVYLILRNFMELKNGPVGFRVFFAFWIAACAGAITVFYSVASHG